MPDRAQDSAHEAAVRQTSHTEGEIMNTITGNCLTEMDRYGDEVLNANWLPW